MKEINPRIHVVEHIEPGFHYYLGRFESFEEVPPKYTWKKIDFRLDNTVVYIESKDSMF